MRTSFTSRFPIWALVLLLALLTAAVLFATGDAAPAGAGTAFDLREHYEKREYRIPMRDGTHLYTAVYAPKDRSEAYPFLVVRTPYSCRPYGEDQFPPTLGPAGSDRFAREGYIFVCQDVRGRYMSEGRYLHMTPHRTARAGPRDVDESTDFYDTVEWLLANVEGHNGRVGIWGISYPGFYTAASIIDTHPAVKAASPQAPIADWFVGDDFHHHGAFFLQDAFGFFYGFESPGQNPTSRPGVRFVYPNDDAYAFFLEMGPLRSANERYFHHRVAFWDSLMAHGTYDAHWQSRNILPHLKNVRTSVLTVGGWFDAEDPYGFTRIYDEIERNNPGIANTMVVGPWFHGGWTRTEGDYLGNVFFGEKTSHTYQEQVDLPFFNYHLKDKGTLDLPEVLAFASGSNAWHRFDAWPPPGTAPASLYFREDGGLSFEPPAAAGEDRYESDPARPVPYTQEVTIARTREYMVEDQRFAARRPDVLVYQTPPLAEDVTLAGPLTADLFVSTTGTDADFVVKLVDVYPDDAPRHDSTYMNVPMAGYQMLVRGEVMRAKFRNSYEHPEPLTPGQVTPLRFTLPDVFHTFRRGHRIMVQVQSSWFPLVDRNPQTFTDIYNATEADFRKATHTVYHSPQHPSRLVVGRLSP